MDEHIVNNDHAVGFFINYLRKLPFHASFEIYDESRSHINCKINQTTIEKLTIFRGEKIEENV